MHKADNLTDRQRKLTTKDKLVIIISKSRVLSLGSALIQYIRINTDTQLMRQEIREKHKGYIKTFVVKDEKRSPAEIGWQTLKAYYKSYRNMCAFHEYFLYHFEDLNKRGRDKFVGAAKLAALYSRLNNADISQIFVDKYRTYETFLPYYNREVVKITSRNDRAAFDSFVKKYGRFIVKPLDTNQGRGIYITSCANRAEADAQFESILQSGKAVIEELITQAPEMAKFHPSSVNTIRYVTYFNGRELKKLVAAIRMGRAGSEVDNASAGGIFAGIDLKYGIINSYGSSLHGGSYLYHPDSGVQLLGTKIPKWDELNMLLEKLVRVVPEQKIIGWDLSLTDRGWVVVEANSDPGFQELIHNHGYRKDLEECFAVAGLNKIL